MARKRTASAETLKPDPRYNSKLASKFINCLMWDGKKATAQRVFYGALDQIKKRMADANPIEVFTQAVEHVKPTVEVRSKRVGGATYQVPMQATRVRHQTLADPAHPRSHADPVHPLDHRRRSRHGRAAHVSLPGRRADGRLSP